MTSIPPRKREQMEIALSTYSQSGASALWEDVTLISSSVPRVGLDSVDLETKFLDHTMQAPLVIAGMTGGHEGAAEINKNLAIAADALGIAIGTGSQRAALAHPTLESTYRIMRETAPEALIIGNLGINQFVPQGDEAPFSRVELTRAIEMLDADMLAIHFNVVEELIQTSGDRNTRGLPEALAQCVDWSTVPIIAKETGAGMSAESAATFAAAGVEALEVGGVGGTSFARVEAVRATNAGDDRGARLGEIFGDWGMPTGLSILEAHSSGLPLIATGGVRSGLDVAKALALGATAVGIGRPMLVAATSGPDATIQRLHEFLEELTMTMVLIDAPNIEALRTHNPVLTGRLAEWMRQRA